MYLETYFHNTNVLKDFSTSVLCGEDKTDFGGICRPSMFPSNIFNHFTRAWPIKWICLYDYMHHKPTMIIFLTISFSSMIILLENPKSLSSSRALGGFQVHTISYYYNNLISIILQSTSMTNIK